MRTLIPILTVLALLAFAATLYAEDRSPVSTRTATSTPILLATATLTPPTATPAATSTPVLIPTSTPVPGTEPVHCTYVVEDITLSFRCKTESQWRAFEGWVYLTTELSLND